MKTRTLSMVIALIVGGVGACVEQAEPVEGELETREVTAEELAVILAGADEVVAVGDIEVATFRNGNACGMTVSAQTYEADTQDEPTITISASCSHGGCAGNPGGCSPAGCQPDYNRTTQSYFCTPPTCSGSGCAPVGCTLKTTITETFLD